MRVLTCVCCGSDVTMPQFHNGMVYGYTCIKKVAPAQKQVKLKFFPVDRATLVRQRNSNVGVIKAMNITYNGKNYFCGDVRDTQIIERDGIMFIREDVFKK